MEGLLAPKWADWERKGAVAPFVKALENKKSSEITLRLNSYKIILYTGGFYGGIFRFRANKPRGK
jgi:hypothetical protein